MNKDFDFTHEHKNGQIQPTKKQQGWFRTEVDFENSFKWWFALQWQNKYIHLFLVGFVLTILELCNLGWIKDTITENFQDGGTMGGIFTIMGIIIPPAIAAIVAYKGFYQYFDDLKHGRSR
jgi:hypothetical protein